MTLLVVVVEICYILPKNAISCGLVTAIEVIVVVKVVILGPSCAKFGMDYDSSWRLLGRHRAFQKPIKPPEMTHNWP